MGAKGCQNEGNASGVGDEAEDTSRFEEGIAKLNLGYQDEVNEVDEGNVGDATQLEEGISELSLSHHDPASYEGNDSSVISEGHFELHTAPDKEEGVKTEATPAPDDVSMGQPVQNEDVEEEQVARHSDGTAIIADHAAKIDDQHITSDSSETAKTDSPPQPDVLTISEFVYDTVKSEEEEKEEGNERKDGIVILDDDAIEMVEPFEKATTEHVEQPTPSFSTEVETAKTDQWTSPGQPTMSGLVGGVLELGEDRCAHSNNVIRSTDAAAVEEGDVPSQADTFKEPDADEQAVHHDQSTSFKDVGDEVINKPMSADVFTYSQLTSDDLELEEDQIAYSSAGMAVVEGDAASVIDRLKKTSASIGANLPTEANALELGGHHDHFTPSDDAETAGTIKPTFAEDSTEDLLTSDTSVVKEDPNTSHDDNMAIKNPDAANEINAAKGDDAAQNADAAEDAVPAESLCHHDDHSTRNMFKEAAQTTKQTATDKVTVGGPAADVMEVEEHQTVENGKSAKRGWLDTLLGLFYV